MMFVTAMLIGVLNHASATVSNVGASIWVMDPGVETIANSVGKPDYVLDAIRSMDGVKCAFVRRPVSKPG
jgi:putative ABC transport system permease protein